MICFDKISNLYGSKIVDIPDYVKDYGVSITDDSKFIPISEAVKKAEASRPMSEVEMKSAYDIVNGVNAVDAELTPHKLYSSDIAEISTEINNSNREITTRLEKAKRDKEFIDSLSHKKTVDEM